MLAQVTELLPSHYDLVTIVCTFVRPRFQSHEPLISSCGKTGARVGRVGTPTVVSTIFFGCDRGVRRDRHIRSLRIERSKHGEDPNRTAKKPRRVPESLAEREFRKLVTRRALDDGGCPGSARIGTPPLQPLDVCRAISLGSRSRSRRRVARCRWRAEPAGLAADGRPAARPHAGVGRPGAGRVRPRWSRRGGTSA